MKINPFTPILLALIGVVIYASYVPDKKPDAGATLTPKQYIERVEEKKKKERAQSTQPDQPSSDK